MFSLKFDLERRDIRTIHGESSCMQQLSNITKRGNLTLTDKCIRHRVHSVHSEPGSLYGLNLIRLHMVYK